jgi:hypothetical protein
MDMHPGLSRLVRTHPNQQRPHPVPRQGGRQRLRLVPILGRVHYQRRWRGRRTGHGKWIWLVVFSAPPLWISRPCLPSLVSLALGHKLCLTTNLRHSLLRRSHAPLPRRPTIGAHWPPTHCSNHGPRRLDSNMLATTAIQCYPTAGNKFPIGLLLFSLPTNQPQAPGLPRWGAINGLREISIKPILFGRCGECVRA